MSKEKERKEGWKLLMRVLSWCNCINGSDNEHKCIILREREDSLVHNFCLYDENSIFVF